jgi:hypothetical protein
MEAEAGA